MEPRLRLGRFCLKQGLNSGPLDQYTSATGAPGCYVDQGQRSPLSEACEMKYYTTGLSFCPCKCESVV